MPIRRAGWRRRGRRLRVAMREGDVDRVKWLEGLGEGMEL